MIPGQPKGRGKCGGETETVTWGGREDRRKGRKSEAIEAEMRENRTRISGRIRGKRRKETLGGERGDGEGGQLPDR